MQRLIALCCLFLFTEAKAAPGARYQDRFVWVFGWNLGQDSDVAQIASLLRIAGEHGFNGAVVSAGLDSLSDKSPDYFRRLSEVQAACATNHLELIPALFSVGYGGGLLARNPNLAEGLPVVDAPFVVNHGQARLASDHTVRLVNGGFEDFTGNHFASFNFYDQPGEISFADTQVKHSGRASLRLENFTANPYGHGRVMQEARVVPHRCYRISIWIKTEGLKPSNVFQLLALGEHDRNVAPREFHLQPTEDWRRISMLVNSLDLDKLRLYAGVWGGKAGKLWLDDWSIEEVGPVNVLNRPGTPLTVRSDDGTVTFQEGKDYLRPPATQLHPWRDTSDNAPVKILPGGRIHEGQKLRVSWFHSMIIYDSQVTLCMAEPELYRIIDEETALVALHLHPSRVILNTDEIRMGGTCRACAGRNIAELLGECVSKQAAILRRHLPGVGIYVWSDMFDPFHNGHGNYFLVDGDFTGAWQHVPKDLIMAVWGGEPQPKDVNFFAQHGFQTLLSCYYDANDLADVKRWIDGAQGVAGARGFMYTTWEKKYDLLPAFGDLLRQ